MSDIITKSQNGKATTTKAMFSRETEVSIEIKSEPSIIWELLVNASDYSRWNSTIVSINGTIAPNEKINLVSTLDPKRTFKLKVKEFVKGKKLVWGDAMGNRTYSINKSENGGSVFLMNERIGGPLFPLFAKMIPSFDESFEKFARDLKKEAETISNAK